MFQIFSNNRFLDDQQFNISNPQVADAKKKKEREELPMA